MVGFSLALTATAANGAFAAPTKPTDTTPDTARTADQPLTLRATPQHFEAETPHLTINIPTRTNETIHITKTPPGHTTRTQPARNQLAISITNGPTARTVTGHTTPDGTITYPNAYPHTDVNVQALTSGVRIKTILNSPAAPTRYSYTLTLPAGTHLQPSPDGGVSLLNQTGMPLGWIAAPWAKDQQHRNVPTHYQIAGNTITQIINHQHKQLTYPIVADPWLGFDLISSARWHHDGNGWSLRVSPTGWARANGGSYSVGVAAWDELYDKYRDHGLNTNLDGMRDQMICHVQFVVIRHPRKPTWNLDEWRPDVSCDDTVRANCTPGPGSGD